MLLVKSSRREHSVTSVLRHMEHGRFVKAYRALPLETPEAREHVRALIKGQLGVAGFYAIRTFLLFAEIKPVRLDPR